MAMLNNQIVIHNWNINTMMFEYKHVMLKLKILTSFNISVKHIFFIHSWIRTCFERTVLTQESQDAFCISARQVIVHYSHQPNVIHIPVAWIKVSPQWSRDKTNAGNSMDHSMFCFVFPIFSYGQGLVNVPFWVYWTSPYSSHLVDHIPNGWVMWKMGTWLMTHVWFSYGFSYGFPMVFLWFSYGFPMVFLWFSYGFPMVFLWFSYGFPMVFLWFSYGFPMVFPGFSNGFHGVFFAIAFVLAWNRADLNRRHRKWVHASWWWAPLGDALGAAQKAMGGFP